MDDQSAPHVEAAQGADLGQGEQAGTNIVMSPERVSALYDMPSGWQLAVQSDVVNVEMASRELC